MSQPNPFGSHSSSSDSEDGGVILAEHSLPPVQMSEKEEEVAAWLSSVAPPSLSPAQKQAKAVRFLDVNSEKRSSTSVQRTRPSPYAMSFPSSSTRTTTTTKPASKLATTSTNALYSANASLALYHLNILTSLTSTPYEGLCPFIKATACPQGPKCTLKVLKPSANTLCPVYLTGDEMECGNRRSHHRRGFLHTGNDGFEEQIALTRLRELHERGEWGVGA